MAEIERHFVCTNGVSEISEHRFEAQAQLVR